MMLLLLLLRRMIPKLKYRQSHGGRLRKTMQTPSRQPTIDDNCLRKRTKNDDDVVVVVVVIVVNSLCSGRTRGTGKIQTLFDPTG